MKELEVRPLKERKRFVLRMIRKAKEIVIEKSGPEHAYIGYFDLMIRHMRLLSKEPGHIQELYLQIVARSLTNRFRAFLTESPESDVYGWELSKHNRKVLAEFALHRIDTGKWLNYEEATIISGVEYHDVKDKDRRWEILEDTLACLTDACRDTPLYGSIRKDVIEICKKKALILSGNYLLSEDWRSELFRKFGLTCRHLAKSRKAIKLNRTDANQFEKSMRKAAELIRSFQSKPVEKEFRAQLWQRNPMIDLLQGNFSQCCIAIGEKGTFPAVRLPEVYCRKYPAGILNYLTDLGIQVAEIYDHNSEDPDRSFQIGQCWLFVALDRDDRPVLVADSFDVRDDYQISESRLLGIRECMFEFLKNYASACGISKVVLGKTGPALKNLRRHEIRNAVPVDDLEVIIIGKPLEKLGGYFLNRPYFLETRGGRDAYLVAENLPVAAVRTGENRKRIWDYVTSHFSMLSSSKRA